MIKSKTRSFTLVDLYFVLWFLIIFVGALILSSKGSHDICLYLSIIYLYYGEVYLVGVGYMSVKRLLPF